MIPRRKFIKMLLNGLTIAALPYLISGKTLAAEAIKKITMSNDEWKKKLTSEQYNILREEGTERAFTSNLLNEHGEGTFLCAGCELPLFNSDTKFDSGTGWPSFFDSIKGSLETKADRKLFEERTEYHCARCGGHHGHVFNDGPKPTGLRYCNNGVALKFVPKKS